MYESEKGTKTVPSYLIGEKFADENFRHLVKISALFPDEKFYVLKFYN